MTFSPSRRLRSFKHVLLHGALFMLFKTQMVTLRYSSRMMNCFATKIAPLLLRSLSSVVLDALSPDAAGKMIRTSISHFYEKVQIFSHQANPANYGVSSSVPCRSTSSVILILTRSGFCPLKKQWNPHFETLEAGCVISQDALLDGLHVHPSAARLDHPPTLTDLPTIFDFEQVLRANKIGRATGFDPLPSALFHNHAAELAEHYFDLFLKVWCWGDEPVQFKGGPMALIPKWSESLKRFSNIVGSCFSLPSPRASMRLFDNGLWAFSITNGILDSSEASDSRKSYMALMPCGSWVHAAQLKHFSMGGVVRGLKHSFPCPHPRVRRWYWRHQ